MKKLLCITLFSLVASTQAKYVSGSVQDAFCGEIDPFVIGDACLVFIEQNDGSLYGLHYHDYDFMSVVLGGEDINSLIGKNVEASACERFVDQDAVYTLKRFAEDYTYFDCYVYDFSL